MGERNRYLVYRLLHHQVSFTTPMGMGERHVDGMVESVARNIFDHTIEVTVGKEKFVFREPTSIRSAKRRVVFVYGEDGDVSDEEVWQEARNVNHRGETVFDVIDRMDGGPVTLVSFDIGAKQRKRKH